MIDSSRQTSAKSPEAAGELLTRPEICALTDCYTREAQAAALEEMGIPYIRRPKSLKVSRELMRQRMLGVELKQSSGVNWSGVK